MTMRTPENIQTHRPPCAGPTGGAPAGGVLARRDGAEFGQGGSLTAPRGARNDQGCRPDEFLPLVESHGSTGAWSWRFGTDTHVWSPGCFRLLGLDPRETRPSYELLRGLVHPGDRFGMARAADLRRGEAVAGHTFRIIRPDGTTRILQARVDVRLDLDGRPRSALGTLLDVTDRERDRCRQVTDRQSLHALDRRTGIVRFSMGPDGRFDFEPTAAEMLGRPLQRVNANPFVDVEPRERAALEAATTECQVSGDAVARAFTLQRPGEAPKLCRLAMVPTVQGQHDIQGWQGLLQILDGPGAAEPAGIPSAPDTLLSGAHLRAARALLDWSMGDLAAASGFSLSTVRRVEADDPSHPVRSRQGVASALRRAGIEFLPLGEGRVAVSLK